MSDAPKKKKKKKSTRPVYLNGGMMRAHGTPDLTQGRKTGKRDYTANTVRSAQQAQSLPEPRVEAPKRTAAAEGGEASGSAPGSVAAAIVGYLPPERTLREKFEDPSRMTWDDFKEQHLDMSADAERRMLEYRQQLDEERDARMRREPVGARGKKEKKPHKEHKRGREKKERKRKDRKRSRRSESEAASDSDASSAHSGADSKRAESKRARKEKRKKEKKGKKGKKADAGPMQLSRFFAQGSRSDSGSDSDSG